MRERRLAQSLQNNSVSLEVLVFEDAERAVGLIVSVWRAWSRGEAALQAHDARDKAGLRVHSKPGSACRGRGRRLGCWGVQNVKGGYLACAAMTAQVDIFMAARSFVPFFQQLFGKTCAGTLSPRSPRMLAL